MSDIVFKIIDLAVIIIFAVIARYVVPYVKLHIGTEKLNQIKTWIETFVRAAEMLFGDKSGKEKLEFVIDGVTKKLNELGIEITEEELRTLIEEAVYAYTHTAKEK